MKRTLLASTAFLACAFGAAMLTAQPPAVPCFPKQANLCCTCPDNYCPKPLPSVCFKVPGCCDDYCPKPLPSVCFKVPGCCDDYCKKPFPKIFKCCPPPAHH